MVKTYKVNFTHSYTEIIQAFSVNQNRYPTDTDLEVLARQVTRKMGVTKQGPDKRNNYTILKAIWDHLEPHI